MAANNRKVSAKPPDKAPHQMLLRGFVVYFWVDRHRRKFAIREKVSALPFPFVCFLYSVLFFQSVSFYTFDKTAFN
jgi:hypothetical protein